MLFLLGTAGCHLCELAEASLARVLTNLSASIDLQLIDIAEQQQWQENYAIRIPVLIDQKSGKELCWPFDEAQIQVFIEQTVLTHQITADLSGHTNNG